MSPIIITGSGGSDEVIEFDPVDEDASNQPLAIGPGKNYGLLEHWGHRCLCLKRIARWSR